MQYLLLIYEEEKRWHNMPQDQFRTEMAQYTVFGQEYGASIQGGNALQPTMTAKTVRVRSGESLINDGPFAETKEQLGGYYLVEANSIEQALAMAAQIPGASTGAVEVRPVMIFSQ